MSSVGSHSIPRADGHWLLGSAKEFAHSPHRFVAELGRQKGSLVQFRVLHKRFLATANPEVAYQVLVSHRERYERGAHYKRIATVTGNGLLVSEGAKWRKRHQIIQPLLRGERLKRLVPTVCDSVGEVLRDWETKRVNGAPIEVVGETQRLTISAIGRILLSTNIGQEAATRLGTALREAMLLLRRHNTSLFALPLGCPIHRNRRLHDHSQFLDRFIESHVEARRRGGQPETNDFLSVLMAAEDPESGEKLPQRAVIDETKTLFLGGFETTSSVMAWTLYCSPRIRNTLAGGTKKSTPCCKAAHRSGKISSECATPPRSSTRRCACIPPDTRWRASVCKAMRSPATRFQSRRPF